MKIFCLIFLAFSLFFSAAAWRGRSAGNNSLLDVLAGGAFVLLGAGFTAQTFTESVILSDDSISYGSVFRRQSIDFSQIRYRLEYEEVHDGADGGVNVSYLELFPIHDEDQALKIPKSDFDLDHAFWQVVMRIPDLESLKNSVPPPPWVDPHHKPPPSW